MKTKCQLLSRWIIVVMMLWLWASLPLSVAQAAPPAQDPRPPAQVGDGGGGKGGGGDEAAASYCASLSGQILDAGLGPQPDVEAELKTGSWRTSSVSASGGEYSMGGLGIGIGILNVLLPSQQNLRASVQDAGVYLNCDFPTIANIAVGRFEAIDAPVTIEMSAPSQTITPDSITKITLTIDNGLSTDISHVVVTDLMPKSLTALAVSTPVESGAARIIESGHDGQLVVVNLGNVAAGDRVIIDLAVHADIDLRPNTRIKNTATLFYRESVANQASLEFTVGSDETAIPAGATTGQDFVPPAEAPATGGDLTAAQSASTESDFAAPADIPTTGAELLSSGKILLAEEDEAPADNVAPADNHPAASKAEAMAADEFRPKNSPMVGVSALLLVTALGLSGLTFALRRSYSTDQNEE